jgi:hypothetical protein
LIVRHVRDPVDPPITIRPQLGLVEDPLVEDAGDADKEIVRTGRISVHEPIVGRQPDLDPSPPVMVTRRSQRFGCAVPGELPEMVTRLTLVVLGSLALIVAGCGGGSQASSSTERDTSSTSATATTATTATTTAGADKQTCEDVKLQTTDGQNVYASEITADGIDCANAQKIAVEWGSQNVGGPSAKLPAGWKCGADGDCTKGSARVTYTLAYR